MVLKDLEGQREVTFLLVPEMGVLIVRAGTFVYPVADPGPRANARNEAARQSG